jgi:hypothetical protein
VLENQERLEPARDARIDELRDVRVRQTSENPAFALEPFLAVAGQRQVEQLDGRAPVEAPVAPVGQPDRAHAALADRRPQGVRTDRLVGCRCLNRERDHASLEESFVGQRTLRVEQSLEIVGDLRAVLAKRCQPGSPFPIVGELQSPVEIRTEGLPPIGIESAHVPVRLTIRTAGPDEGRFVLFPNCAERSARMSRAWPRFPRTRSRKRISGRPARRARGRPWQAVERIADVGQLALVGDLLVAFDAE